MKEIWKPCKAGYEISNFGRLKSMFRIVNSGNGARRPIRERIIRLTSSPNGYPIHKNTTIHRLVAIAFIPNPENKPTVNHKDWNKKNNHVSNLEWNTRSENIRHSYKMPGRKISNMVFKKGENWIIRQRETRPPKPKKK